MNFRFQDGSIEVARIHTMNIRFFLFGGILFLFGGLSGFFFYPSMKGGVVQSEESESKQIRQIGKYAFINPLLECEVAKGSIDAYKENFHDELEELVDDMRKRYELSEASVYFRDLNNGPAFGSNEGGEFFPASLLKVPVMMAYFRWSESEPSLLRMEITYEAPRDFGVVPTIIPQEEIVVGKTYTVAELIRRMIVHSDNQALGLLVAKLPIEKIQDLFTMLGVGEDVLVNSQAKLSVKEYAGFFRILFNSSYLSRDNSEKALALLSSTDFSDALVAGVPKEISVAHKFGEAGSSNTERQLHDCGIVYFPNHPYLACIMTRGKDTDKLKQAIVDVSRFIYDKIDEQY